MPRERWWLWCWIMSLEGHLLRRRLSSLVNSALYLLQLELKVIHFFGQLVDAVETSQEAVNTGHQAVYVMLEVKTAGNDR